MSGLHKFIAESNRIEGIRRDPTTKEISAHHEFLMKPITVESLCTFVAAIQPGAKLRDKPGMNVRVGSHFPPVGGPHIREWLQNVINSVDEIVPNPYAVHIAYETLHPFMDGNGRSGRAIWLHQMFEAHGEIPPLGFLHTFYYQTLDAPRAATQHTEGESE